MKDFVLAVFQFIYHANIYYSMCTLTDIKTIVFKIQAFKNIYLFL